MVTNDKEDTLMSFISNVGIVKTTLMFLSAYLLVMCNGSINFIHSAYYNGFVGVIDTTILSSLFITEMLICVIYMGYYSDLFITWILTKRREDGN